jgi:Ca2+-binding RTX toxin-like protein
VNKTSSFVLTLLAAVFVLAAPASGAVIEHTASTGVAEEDLIVYTAAAGEKNGLTVTAGRKTLTFSDGGADVIRRKRGDFGACRAVSARRAVCTIDPATPIILRLGDRHDRVRFAGGLGTSIDPTDRSSATDAWRLADAHEDEADAAVGRVEIHGGEGYDSIGGTRYRDFIDPGRGRDIVYGGKGDDRIVHRLDRSADTIYGGDGFDTVDVQGRAGVKIDLEEGRIAAGRVTTALESIESARGGSGDDTLTGTDDADGLFGDGGNDTIDGRGGDDYLSGDLYTSDFGPDGSRGGDLLTGGGGNDVLDGRDDDAGNFTPGDRLDCGDGTDTIVARQDDLAIGCESAAFGDLSAAPADQSIDRKATAGVVRAGTAPDGSPIYEVACPDPFGSVTQPPCKGRVQIELTPADANTEGRVIGSGSFSIPRGTRAMVTVKFTSPPPIAPGPLAVHVLAGEPAGEDGEDANFGWQYLP